MLSLSSGAVEILDNSVIKVMHPHLSGSFFKLTLTPPSPHLRQMNQNLLVEPQHTDFEKAFSGNFDMYLSIETLVTRWKDQLL